MKEQIANVMIITPKNTFFRGWIRPANDNKFSLGIDSKIHPYIDKGDKIEFVDVLAPYKVR